MKILLVSYYFPPTNAIGSVRAGKFAKHLIAQGHDVRVLTANEPFLPKTLPMEIDPAKVIATAAIDLDRLPQQMFGRWATETYFGTESGSNFMTWLGKTYKTFATLPDGQIGWVPFALWAGRKMLRDWHPDLIYASAMPFSGLLVARHLGWKFGIPRIAELRDLWVDNHYYDYPAWRRAIETVLERLALADTLAMVTVSEPLSQILRNKYGRPTSVIMNGFDPEDYPTDKVRNPTPRDELHIVYTGLIYPNRRDPSALFEAIRMLGPEGKRIKVEFFGRRLPTISFLAREYGVSDQVVVHGPVSFKEAVRHQISADILLLLLWNSSGERGVFTGKLFEYLGARRPILCVGLERGVAANLIREREAGFASNNAEQIAAKLSSWLHEKRESGQIAPLTPAAVVGVSRSEQFDKLDSFLADVLRRKREPRSPGESRILHVITGLRSGGAERMLFNLVSGPRPESTEVRVVSLTRGGHFMAKLREAGIEVTDLGIREPVSLSLGMWRLARLIRCYKPNLVQSWMYHADLAATFALLLSGRRRRTRFYWGVRCSNMDQRRYSIILRFVIRLCAWLSRIPDAVIANSYSGLEYHEKIGYRSRTSMVMPNGVDIGIFQPDSQARRQVRRELGLSDDQPVVVMVARKDPMKDHPTFYLAMERLPGVTAFLIGNGTELLPEKANIRRIGETGNVARYLAAGDLIVSSSAYGEGLSNSLLEGMACGLPAVATDVGDARRIIDDTGLVVPPENPEALAAAILTLLEEPADTKRARRVRVREHIAQNFSLESARSDSLALYRNDTAGNSRVSTATEIAGR